jgi:hypothetical protein
MVPLRAELVAMDSQKRENIVRWYRAWVSLAECSISMEEQKMRAALFSVALGILGITCVADKSSAEVFQFLHRNDVLAALYTPRPEHADPNIRQIKECTGNTFQCRLGVSTWCCPNGKKCDYDDNPGTCK